MYVNHYVLTKRKLVFFTHSAVIYECPLYGRLSAGHGVEGRKWVIKPEKSKFLPQGNCMEEGADVRVRVSDRQISCEF